MKKKAVGFLAVTMIIFWFLASHDGGAVCLAAGEKSGSAPAEEIDEAAVGTIDIATVYALHPSMIYFDSNMNLFIKPVPAGTTSDDFMKIMADRREDYKKREAARSAELKRLKDDIDSARQAIRDHEVKKITECSPVNEKYDALIQGATGEAQVKKYLVERTAALKSVEDKFNAELGAKRKKLSDALEKYEKLQISLLGAYYLSEAETAAKFEEINADIKKAVKEAARANGVKAVVNFKLDGYKSKKKNDPERPVGIEEKEKTNAELESLLKTGPDYDALLDSLKAYDAADAGRPDALLKKSFEPASKAREMAASPFFSKGKDLTWFTVIKLMVNNGVPKEKAEAVSAVLEDVYGRPGETE